MNTLGVRSAIGSANRRKLSFRNVSNVVVQLLHTIKYSVPVPFSHLSAPNTNYMGTTTNSAIAINESNNRKVRVFSAHLQIYFSIVHSKMSNFSKNFPYNIDIH